MLHASRSALSEWQGGGERALECGSRPDHDGWARGRGADEPACGVVGRLGQRKALGVTAGLTASCAQRAASRSVESIGRGDGAQHGRVACQGDASVATVAEQVRPRDARLRERGSLEKETHTVV